ncbi:uncharacterized protein Dwil_GK20043 [Drosophila willistoni]|uniref:EGF-like domain-containing protein n=1 Tax=Drosophila willistoni TaxID=7260 RepID=B4MSV5_DROWI|nr:putative vitellogenin receptor isoform X1 [Drosophila willistoni]EDW75194.2 uncharacterized protein Dwil_GK20043 [Drosophila willistoni]
MAARLRRNVRDKRHHGCGYRYGGQMSWHLCQLAAMLLLLCRAPTAAPSGSAHMRCNADQFQCGDGSCILQAKMCDGRRDCPDNTDELECDYKMCRQPHWFPCAQTHGACLAAELKCNGVENCPGGEDELNCPGRFGSSRRLNCSLFEYMCQDDHSCIPLDFMCDGKPDCPDSSDELAGCKQSAASCTTGHVCANGKCLKQKSWVCDGVDDCGDGSDEQGCGNLCQTEHGKFLCRNRLNCLPLSQVCDGHPDCSDNSDESESCHSKPDCSSKQCPPGAKCHMMPASGPECYCPQGFRLSNFASKCEDIDECQGPNDGLCSQSCENTSGGYKCLCDDGYELASDNRTCRVSSEEPLLLYTTQNTVMGMHIKGMGQRSHLMKLAGNLTKVIGVAYDGRQIYWTNIQNEGESIVKANPDGTNPQILLTSGLDAPEDLAVDWLTQNIYFSDNIMRHIAVCSNDGLNCVVLVTQDVHQPRGLALWPERGQMFWTDWGDKPMIARASMDGTHSMPLVTENIHWPNGIALDMHQQRIYWVDAKLGNVQTVRPDGTGRRTVLDGMLKHPYGLAVFEDELYWSDWGTKSIHVCHKQTGKHHRIVAKDRSVFAVHIYHSAKQPKVKHACETVRCSHLCLLAQADAGGYSCACPDGMQLAEDQQRCVKTEKRQRLFIGVHNIILEIEHTSFGRHLVSASHTLPYYAISEMVYNNVNGSLILADNMKRQIFEYHPNENTLNTLVSNNLGNVSALAFDYLSRNLYWADAERRVIEILSLQTMQRAVIRFFQGQESPIGLSVMPTEGYLYVALKARRHSHIDKLPLSGQGEQVHVFEEDLGDDDIKMVADPLTHTLFWSDSDVGRIMFTDYRKAQAQLFRGKLRRPYSLALVQQDLFWSELGTPAIYWTHKTNMGPRKRIDVEPTKGAPLSPLPARIPIAASMSSSFARQDHPCQHQNGGCSHICVGVGQHVDSVICLCPPGFVFRDASNRSCIENLDCEFRCRSGECLTQAHRCNSRQDCVDHSDEENCDAAEKPTKSAMCTANQFTCHNGEQCLPKKQRCDGNSDCLDGSDEQHCALFDKTKDCHEHQFACDNGKCVDSNLVCDNVNDCGDNSDENKCKTPAKCASGMFQCNGGSCIAASWECDGRIDCTDGSDEHDKCAHRQCPDNMHRCQLGQCLDRKLVCDSHNDCGDHSDELNCGAHGLGAVNISCPDHLYQCASNLKLCFDQAVRCNGTAECPRGEDEANCGDVCSIYEFQCRSGNQCIRKEFHCDGERDCDDGSDEVLCDNQKGQHKNQSAIESWSTARRTCRPHLFDCQDGDCLDMSRVCNNFNDCLNGNDEGPQCATACRANAGGRKVCQHKCRATPAGAVCSCFDGYRLDIDQRSCVDIDECAEQQPCAQLCENTRGGYQCQCHADFMLRQDRVSCKSIQGGGSSLLFSSYNEVRNFSDQPVMLSVAWSANDSRISGFDLDMIRELAYFSSEEQDAIYQIDVHTHHIKRALSLKSPTKLSVDWTTGNVYVLHGTMGGGSSFSHQISVCSFEAKMCGRIIEMRAKNQMHLKHLAVDAYHARLFYVAVRLDRFGPSTSEMYMSRLDGSRQELLLHKPSSYITALAIDPHQQHLYYTDLHNRRLERLSYVKRSGPIRKPEVLLQKSNAIVRPSGLSVYENQAYIINLGSTEAVQCRLYGSRTCHAINLNVLNAQDIVIGGKSRQPRRTSNPCEMAHCHGMCLLADYGFECMCGSQVVAETERCPHGLNHELEDWPGSAANRLEKGGLHFGRIMIILVLILIVGLTAGLGYMYYQYRKRGHKDLNINLHFQNPLARLNSKTIEEAEQQQQQQPGTIGYGTSTTTSTSSFVPEQFTRPTLMQRLWPTKQSAVSGTVTATAKYNGEEMVTDILLENTRGSELQAIHHGRTARSRGVGEGSPLIMVGDSDDNATLCGDYPSDDAHARLVP